MRMLLVTLISIPNENLSVTRGGDTQFRVELAE